MAGPCMGALGGLFCIFFNYTNFIIPVVYDPPPRIVPREGCVPAGSSVGEKLGLASTEAQNPEAGQAG